MNIRYRSALPLIAAAALLAVPAQAQQSAGRLSYTYGDARLVVLDPDGPGNNFTGPRLGGALQFNPDLFGFASLSALGSNGADYDVLDFGVGYRAPVAADTDFVATLGIVWAEFSPPGPRRGDDDIGIALGGGVRSHVGPQVELGGYVGYTEIFGDGTIMLTGEGLLHLTPQWSLAGSLGFSDDVTLLTVGGRYNFGGRAGSRAAR